MKKGFNYWGSIEIRSFIKRFWPFSIIIHFIAIYESFKTSNPFTYLFIGGTTHLFLVGHKLLHNHLYKLEESISTLDPKTYDFLLAKDHEMKISNFMTSKSRLKEIRFYCLLMKYGKNSENNQINKYVANIELIEKNRGINLGLYFFTFLIMIFLLYHLR